MGEEVRLYLHTSRTPRKQRAASRSRDMAPRALSSGRREEGWRGVESEGVKEGEEGRTVSVPVLAHWVIPRVAMAHNTSAPEREREGRGQVAVRWWVLSRF